MRLGERTNFHETLQREIVCASYENRFFNDLMQLVMSAASTKCSVGDATSDFSIYICIIIISSSEVVSSGLKSHFKSLFEDESKNSAEEYT